jgi:hypothetical protein
LDGDGVKELITGWSSGEELIKGWSSDIAKKIILGSNEIR